MASEQWTPYDEVISNSAERMGVPGSPSWQAHREYLSKREGYLAALAANPVPAEAALDPAPRLSGRRGGIYSFNLLGGNLAGIQSPSLFLGCQQSVPA